MFILVVQNRVVGFKVSLTHHIKMSMGSAYSRPIKYTLTECNFKRRNFPSVLCKQNFDKSGGGNGASGFFKGKMSKLHPDNLPSHPKFPC